MADYNSEIDYANMISSYENAEGESDEYTEDSDDQDGASYEDGNDQDFTPYEQEKSRADDDETYEQATEAGVSTQYTSAEGDDDEYTNDDTTDDSSSSGSSSSSSSSSSSKSVKRSGQGVDDRESSDNDTNDFESAETSENDVESGSTPDSHNNRNDERNGYDTHLQSSPRDSQHHDAPESISSDDGGDDDSEHSTSQRESNSDPDTGSTNGTASIASSEENGDIGNDDFQDEFEPKETRKTASLEKSKRKRRSPDPSHGSGSISGSDSDNFDDEYNSHKSEKKSLNRRRAEDSPLKQEREVISHREKLLSEREGNVNTRERRFTRWIIALAVLICLGAGALVALYLLEPFGKNESSKNEDGVSNSTLTPSPTPSLGPSIGTIGPTGLDVVVAVSFVGIVPMSEGATVDSVDENLETTLNEIAPNILNTTNSSNPVGEGRRYNARLRRRLDAIFVRTPVDVLVNEIDCPSQLQTNEEYQCFYIDVNITLATDDGTAGDEFVTVLENAVDSGALEEAYTEVNPQSTIKFFLESPPSNNATQAPSLRGSLVPTIAPSRGVTQSPTNLRGSTVSPAPTITNMTISPAPTSFEKPSPSPSLPPSKLLLNTSDDFLDDDESVNETQIPAPTLSPTESECVDKNDSCGIWSNAGECETNPSYMLANCRLSCKACAGEFICQDSDERCELWAKAGECESNPNFMLANCKRACGECNDQENCTDDNTQCAGWASLGECDTNPQFMLSKCRESCGVCSEATNSSITTKFSLTSCANKDESCESLASEGECEVNFSYMNENCALACGKCDETVEEAKPTHTTDIPAPSCEDSNDSCERWANEGNCEMNPSNMLEICRRSCNVCEEEIVV